MFRIVSDRYLLVSCHAVNTRYDGNRPLLSALDVLVMFSQIRLKPFWTKDQFLLVILLVLIIGGF
jgi:hypothetical protein